MQIVHYTFIKFLCSTLQLQQNFIFRTCKDIKTHDRTTVYFTDQLISRQANQSLMSDAIQSNVLLKVFCWNIRNLFNQNFCNISVAIDTGNVQGCESICFLLIYQLWCCLYDFFSDTSSIKHNKNVINVAQPLDSKVLLHIDCENMLPSSVIVVASTKYHVANLNTL